MSMTSTLICLTGASLSYQIELWAGGREAKMALQSAVSGLYDRLQSAVVSSFL